MDTKKPKQKISLQEYRDRSKSKSPSKLDADSKSSVEGTADKREIAAGKHFTNEKSPPSDIKEGRIHNESDKELEEYQTVVSDDDDVIDISFDVRNMSIHEDGLDDEYTLDERTGEFIAKKPDKKINRALPEKSKLKLKKASSSSSTNETVKPSEGKPMGLSESPYFARSKGLTNSNQEQSQKADLSSLSLSERIKRRAGGDLSNERISAQSAGGAKHVGTGSGELNKTSSPVPDVIDLTEDEDSPAPEQARKADKQTAPVKSVDSNLNHPIKSTDTLLQQKQPIKTGDIFHGKNNQPVPSFESLSKQTTGQVTVVHPKQGEQWTSVRSQGDSSAGLSVGFKPAAASLHQSLQDDLRRRKELAKLLEKQKVCLGETTLRNKMLFEMLLKIRSH